MIEEKRHAGPPDNGAINKFISIREYDGEELSR